jgi:HPt (histidine-containing phosphotransfer) domain-containing protein
MTIRSDRLSVVGVDLADLLSRVENDVSLLGELVSIFKEEFPTLLRELQESIARKDIKKIEVTSHAMKGMLSGLSATRAAAIASQVEQMARDGKSSGLADSLTALECEVDNLLPELDAYVAEAQQ